ncbi:MAG: NGG1p interacting factor NIF3 [Candidatus Omnitrophica bacterium]|nr:NGG1p interacting factor NIF3 [Candidatus Omnitrophota bacterium]
MKLKTLYEEVIKKGLKEDPRSKKTIEEGLKETKKEYSKAQGIDKKMFDPESLKHPYADTRILNTFEDEDIKTVMVGIDIDVSEILLADRLKEKGVNIDLVVSHHPSGKALANLHRVMAIQPGIWEKYGLSKEIAVGIMKDRIEQVARSVASSNHTKTADAAKLLGIPFICTHTPADNCVTSYLQKLLNRKKPKKLKNIVSILKTIPEYKKAMENNAGPFVLVGKDNADAGKIFVDMTGGTSGPDKMLARLSQAGVKTIVGMHCKESAYKLAGSEFINYVIAGHISSDNLGMNLLFDAIEKKSKLKFIECSGFRRIRRK